MAQQNDNRSPIKMLKSMDINLSQNLQIKYDSKDDEDIDEIDADPKSKRLMLNNVPQISLIKGKKSGKSPNRKS